MYIFTIVCSPACRRLTCCFSMAGAQVHFPLRRVQERNVDAVMACALPYHATPQFVRLVQVRHAITAHVLNVSRRRNAWPQ